MPLACIVLPRQRIVVEGSPYLADLGVSLLNFPFNICLYYNKYLSPYFLIRSACRFQLLFRLRSFRIISKQLTLGT